MQRTMKHSSSLRLVALVVLATLATALSGCDIMDVISKLPI